MEEIVQYVAAHWTAWLFAAASTMLLAGYRRLSKQIHEEHKKAQALDEAVLALLHDRLYQACTYHLRQRHCTLEDRDNLEYMFRPYKALGGNGTGEELYHRCLALPYEAAESEVQNGI